jgi:hypothetical protein
MEKKKAGATAGLSDDAHETMHKEKDDAQRKSPNGVPAGLV